MCLLARKQFKICGVYSSSCSHQGNSVRLRIYESHKFGRSVIVAMSMKDLIIKKEAVFKASTSYYVSYDRH